MPAKPGQARSRPEPEPRYDLSRMSWTQAKEVLAQGTPVVIPIGSTEQHGPHMPLGTDYLVAEHIANRVAAEGNYLVTPVLPVGYAAYHLQFAGTLTLSPEVLQEVIQQLADSLTAHGATHLIFINGHGGNTPALNQVCFQLRQRGIAACSTSWFTAVAEWFPAWGVAGHAQWLEASVMMAVDPASVDLSKAPSLDDVNEAASGSPAPGIHVGGAGYRFEGVTAAARILTGDYTASGVMPGSGAQRPITDASVEAGQQVIDRAVTWTVDFIESFRQLRLDSVRPAGDTANQYQPAVGQEEYDE